MSSKIVAFAILVLFALFCGAIVAVLTWILGARPAAATIAGGSTFGGAMIVGIAALTFLLH